MEEYDHRSKEDLKTLYVEKNLTIEEIEEVCSVSKSTISKWLNRFNIETGYKSNQHKDIIRKNYCENKSFSEMSAGTPLTESQFRHRAVENGMHEPTKSQSYTDNELLSILQEQKEKHGKISKRTVANDDSAPAPITFRKRFGGWNAAVREAEINPNKQPEDSEWTKDGILNEFERLDEKRPKHLINSNNGPNSYTTIRKIFGSVKEMLNESDLQPKQYPPQHMPDKAGIKILSDEFKSVSAKRIQENNNTPSSSWYRSRFGSIEEACAAANVEYKNNTYSVDEIKSELQDKSDGDVSWSDIKKMQFSPTAIKNAAGKKTIGDAVEDLGFEYNSNSYTKDELIDLMKRCKEKHGEVKVGLFKTDDELPSWFTYINMFGSWSKAKKNAGIEPENGGRPSKYEERHGATYIYGPAFYNKRDDIRERDSYECQKCGTSEESLDRELDVHHITPVISFEDPDDAHTKDNLISLCHSCHMAIEANNIECPEPPRSRNNFSR